MSVLADKAERAIAGVYSREPLEVIDGIPIFSKSDTYTENYARIAADHLRVQEHSGENPFIEGELWEATEASTADLVRKHARPGNRILDVGVGLGRLLERFSSFDCYGMDISLEYLRVSKQKGISVCFSRIEEIPYQQGFFDVVLCTDVLEHVLDLNLCLANMLGTLKDGGYLIIRVPYRENLSPYLTADYPYHFAHLRNFDEFGLTLLLERVFHLKVVEYSFAGRSIDRTRLKYPLPIGNRLFAGLVRLVRKLAPFLGDYLSRRLFQPVEINVVARKQVPGGVAGCAC